MILNMKLKWAIKLIAVALITVTFSCQPDEIGNGNGLTATDMDASFSVTEVSGVNNTYMLESNNSYITSSWNLGIGAGFFTGGNSEEVFYPDAGTYTVQHKVSGIGGAESTVSQIIEVETSDPLFGNIVRGGKFDTADDIAEWTVLNISASGAEWTFADGKATIQGGGWNQKAIYQAIEVVEGQTYNIDMLASSTSGIINTWFEVFASATQPVDGNDYSAGGILASINYWSGCGDTPFSGLLSEVGCGDTVYPGEPGKFIAEATGTIYLVIKCGGENLLDGISIDNVEMRASN
ncbi:hypothetical protein HNV10_10280 [Winogradskyella litoriviva]|uniref:PKD domain-containing protein n=1 Tax=Winogradskyella litoriviva TaxID=1220182 RepID=A0ABX2E759_9FLAO|nr:PKD domain-containing protein [Winogradskyella litoriviva]NRD23629.1 hypothetical protein [Winogradskyella litoriviva]